MRRRLLPACLALLVLTGVFLVLPVYSAPHPKPVPVVTAADEVPMGSVTAPAPVADVRPGTTSAVAGAPDTTPTLTVTRTHVRTFSMVGVTWAFDAAVTGTVVQVRVQDDTGAWGHWTQIGIEDAVPNADAASGKNQRGGTAPLWTGPSTGVQAELTTRSGAQPADVKLDLIDPGTSAADSALDQPAIRDTAHAASAMPPVYSRAQWGADESIRTWAPQYAGAIKAATIHHSADSNDYTADEVPALMRSIYRYHTVNLGWGDIGYNVIVDKFGRMWEGRSGGLASTVIGAHAGGFNTYTFGVSMLGNYDLVDTPPAVITAVSSIISWKFSLYGVNPRGTTTLTSAGGGTSKYAAGVKVTVPTIFAHRDVGATICPGRYAYARMDQIRDRVSGTVVDLTTISQRYDSDAALRTQLGTQTTPPALTADGSGGYATYQNGSLYYSAATGVRMLRGPIRDLWSSTGAEAGVLRYPTSDVGPTADGTGQSATFQGGSIFWTAATGARAMLGPIRDLWTSTGAEHGPLGYPTSSVSTATGGTGQYAHFQHGSIFWSAATGARAMLGPIRDLWASTGWERGALGYPTTSVSTAADGTGQYAHFQSGSIYWSPGTGARAMLGPVRDLWNSTGAEHGTLGYPTTSVSTTADGTGQYATFTGGSIYSTPETGARALLGPIEALWRADGAEQGDLGYPVTSVSTAADGVGRYAHFQGGSVYWAPATGAQKVLGAVQTLWTSTGAERGVLGYPTSSVAATTDGVGEFAHFQGGAIYSTPDTGTRALLGPVQTLWTATGAEAGPLGYPTTSVSTTADKKGQYATFEKGSIYWTQATGARAMLGPIDTLWKSTGAERGLLGYPTTSVSTTADGKGQYARFQGGSIYWTAATGTRAVLGPIQTLWTSSGAERGALGYPTSSVSTARDGKGQYATFEHGSIYWSAATGARALLGPIKDRWVADGAERGVLGYPTTSVSTSTDKVGQYAKFVGGSVYWSPTTGARVLRGAFLTAYAAAGYERGYLGYPTKDAYAVTGGSRMDFQHGSITVSASTGKATVVRR